MIWLLLACTARIPETTASVPCDYCNGDCVDETQSIGTANHVDGDIAYPDPPPTSGNHNSCWSEWGVHEADPGAEHWVHNEEHGGVVFLYQPADCNDVGDNDAGGDNDCAADVEALASALGEASDPRWIIAPYDELPSVWAAVSWGQRRMLGCFDLDALTVYYETWVGHGAEDETASPPSTCG